jgi:N-acetylglucosamine-6-sulfatase
VVVPRGWSAWLANGGGDYISPSFAASGIRGVDDSPSFQTPDGSYTTAVVGNLSVAWIEAHVAVAPEVPFFAHIAPKAPHESFMPAPWYVDHWDESWPDAEPRPPPWNASAAERSGHPADVAGQAALTQEAADVITGIFRNRGRCLLSVDDLEAGVVGSLEDLGVAEETYVLFTSDHGFMLGEINFLMD